MFGLNGAGGILARSAEFVLRSNELIVSAIGILGNKYYDVISGNQISLNESAHPTQKQVQSIEMFNVNHKNILHTRTQKSTNHNAILSRSHLIVKFKLSISSKSEMAFVDLAGWENPDGKEISESKFINKTLTELNTVLMQVSAGKVATFNTPLLKQLKQYFT